MEDSGYKKLTVQTALNRLKRKVPYSWDLNSYRGCEHACRYCYAQYSHKYLGSQNFTGDIYVKTNIAEALEQQLCSDTWKPAIVPLP